LARRVRLIVLTALLAALGFAFAPAAFSQAGPVAGENELQIWTGGGHGINGSQSGDGIWNLGLRFGLILAKPHGPGFLRGQLEYALEVVPAFVVVQKTNTAYGAGVNPFAFKWMMNPRGSVMPYFEIGGGTLFTNTNVPEKTSQINFTSGGALGLHFVRSKFTISPEVRFMHISNAGLSNPNPGINTIQFRIGFGRFGQK